MEHMKISQEETHIDFEGAKVEQMKISLKKGIYSGKLKANENTVSSSYPRTRNMWLLGPDCTMSLYIRDLSIP